MEKYDCQMANTALIVERRFESKFQSEGTGSAVHVYDGNGDEVLTYTAGEGCEGGDAGIRGFEGTDFYHGEYTIGEEVYCITLNAA